MEPSGSLGGPQQVEREFTIKSRNQAQLIFRRFLRQAMSLGDIMDLILEADAQQSQG